MIISCSSSSLKKFNEPLSRTEFINEFWGEAQLFNTDAKSRDIVLAKKDYEDNVEDLDISVFKENLEEIEREILRGIDILEKYKNYIFYGEVCDVLKDIQMTNKMYLDGSKNAKYFSSNKNLAIFIETIFMFIQQINSSLNKADFEELDELMEQVDDIYQQTNMNYYFRQYEDDFEEYYEDEEDYLWQEPV